MYSKFLDGTGNGATTNIYDVKTERNIKSYSIHEVGTCGLDRNHLLDGSCFCMLVDNKNNCVYNHNFDIGDDT